MKKLRKRAIVIPSVLIMLVLSCFAGKAADQPLPENGSNRALQRVEFSSPKIESQRSYLGLSGTGRFTVAQINAPIVLIEVLSVYCPHCQRTAPLMEKVYKKIEGTPTLKGKIKIIGVGMSNSVYEVELFRKKYTVSFPLVPDENDEFSGKLHVMETPTFIGAKVDGKGSAEQFFFRAGELKDPTQFLSDFVKAADME